MMWHQLHHSPPTSSRIRLPVLAASAMASCMSFSGSLLGSYLGAVVCFSCVDDALTDATLRNCKLTITRQSRDRANVFIRKVLSRYRVPARLLETCDFSRTAPQWTRVSRVISNMRTDPW